MPPILSPLESRAFKLTKFPKICLKNPKFSLRRSVMFGHPPNRLQLGFSYWNEPPWQPQIRQLCKIHIESSSATVGTYICKKIIKPLVCHEKNLGSGLNQAIDFEVYHGCLVSKGAFYFMERST